MGKHKHFSSIVRQRRSSALLSTHPDTETCVVFVHGFFGNAATTWGQFQDLCDFEWLGDSKSLERFDLYFYDYGAEKDFVKWSADELGGS